MMPEYTTIRSECDDRVALVTLARPDRRNAISPLMLTELEDAFVRADDDDRVHVVLLRGDGPSFCSGYDLAGTDYGPYGVDAEHGRGASNAIDDDLWRVEQGQKRMLAIFRGGCPDAKLRDRIDAATWLPDRGFGKPVQAMAAVSLDADSVEKKRVDQRRIELRTR